jgi:hypothetical protein
MNETICHLQSIVCWITHIKSELLWQETFKQLFAENIAIPQGWRSLVRLYSTTLAGNFLPVG